MVIKTNGHLDKWNYNLVIKTNVRGVEKKEKKREKEKDKKSL